LYNCYNIKSVLGYCKALHEWQSNFLWLCLPLVFQEVLRLPNDARQRRLAHPPFRVMCRTTIALQLETNGIEPETNLSVKASRNLFFAVKEAVRNVYKHSQANSLNIQFHQTEVCFEIVVIDDGIGLSDSFEKGNGMTNMSLRMESINGIFKIIPVQNGSHLLFKYYF
jgi:signal transduction histidine kinase